jgi:cellulose synthase/poly-beta-1,6-N-acetylglucosamine synthase-like glycosyltransferase
MNSIISIFSFMAILICSSYWWIIALASIRPLKKTKWSRPMNRFAIVIPAHNEETVIGSTVAKLRKQNYPEELFDIYVVADYCSDSTHKYAVKAGARAYERSEGTRGTKGLALGWLFQKIFENHVEYDAIVIFDADTQVDKDFLQYMNANLVEGIQIIQGKHVISNPLDSWFAALTWAMMTIDNRFSNQGRTNLRLSAKHMGDSICFRCEILKRFGWGKGLTEDYELRLRLLLDGIVIHYEPNAIGFGQAPKTIGEALAQRLRWAKGMADARKIYRKQMVREVFKKPSFLNIDAALGMIIPSYSTLTLISVFALGLNIIFPADNWSILPILWTCLIFSLIIYPLFGLALERAPGWAYVAISFGLIFIVWRTFLNIRARLLPNGITWKRTEHRL